MNSSQRQKKRSTEKDPIPIRDDGSPASTPDSLLNAKLSRMSMEERSNGLNEVHGIVDVPHKRPKMVMEKCRAMSRALLSAIARLSAEKSLAYREAFTMSQDYVDGLKIPFLRAENDYDSEKAAHRMISFFDHKKKMFGKEKLVQNITLEDLGAEASEALRRGLFQVLPQRDRAGRPIFYCQGLVNMLFPMKTCVSGPQRRKEGDEALLVAICTSTTSLLPFDILRSRKKSSFRFFSTSLWQGCKTR
jgi:hypothetical protein